MRQASATAGTATRAGAKAEVDELLEFASSPGNTRDGDEYLPGGHFTEARPLDAGAGFTQPPGSRRFRRRRSRRRAC